MFNEGKTIGPTSEEEVEESNHSSSNWQPSHNHQSAPSSSYPKYVHHSTPPTGEQSTEREPYRPSTTYHHNLPYDSYNPKYNNNPD